MKEWLEEKRIYFDLFPSVLISLAALFISISSYNISRQQLQINDIQLNPHFHVETQYILDPKDGKYNEIVMSVYNSGAPINNADFSVSSFIVIDYEKNLVRKKLVVPITGYYTVMFNNQRPLGEFVSFKGHLNNKNFYKLNNEFLVEKVREKYGFVNLEVENIITINYSDRKGEKKEAYFYNNTLVDKENIKDKLNLYETVPFLEIQELTAEQLMKKIPKYSEYDID